MDAASPHTAMAYGGIIGNGRGESCSPSRAGAAAAAAADRRQQEEPEHEDRCNPTPLSSHAAAASAIHGFVTPPTREYPEEYAKYQASIRLDADGLTMASPSSSGIKRKRVTEPSRENEDASDAFVDLGKPLPAAPKRKGSSDYLRKGQWTPTEERLARLLIEAFEEGYLPIYTGIRLRGYLAVQLQCDPMRVSKKLCAGSIDGKQIPKNYGQRKFRLRKKQLWDREEAGRIISTLERLTRELWNETAIAMPANLTLSSTRNADDDEVELLGAAMPVKKLSPPANKSKRQKEGVVSPYKIAIAPDNTFTREYFMQTMDQWYPRIKLLNGTGVVPEIPSLRESVVFYKTVKDLEDYIASNKYGDGSKNPRIYGGIVFDKLPSDDEIGQFTSIEYTLRFNSTSGRDASRFVPRTNGDPPAISPFQRKINVDDYPRYATSGFMTLQTLVTRFVTCMPEWNATTKTTTGRCQRSQTTAPSSSDIDKQLLTSLDKDVQLQIALPTLWSSEQNANQDGPSSPSDGRGSAKNASSIAFSTVIARGDPFVQEALLKPLRQVPQAYLGGAVAPFPIESYVSSRFYDDVKEDFALIFILAYLYCVSRILVVLIQEKESRLREYMKILGVKENAIIVSWYITYGQGIAFANISVLSENFRFSTALLFFLVDTVLYTLLGLYFENVLPKEYGTTLKWYFPVSPSYWRGRGLQKAARTNSDDDVVLGEDSPSAVDLILDVSPNVEPVGADLREQERNGDVLSIQRLRKVFPVPGGEKVAVKGLNLVMYKDQITCLLGHNGAGKTTLISMLTGMSAPSSGTASFQGLTITDDMDEIRESLGICFQHDVLFADLTVEEHLLLFGQIKGYANEELRAVVDRQIQEVGLNEKRNVLSSALSGGMKRKLSVAVSLLGDSSLRKLSVAVSLLGDSSLVFLDEPTSGMDPYSRRSTWELLLNNRHGRVMVLTTHFMDEADILGDRIAIMAEGGLRCCGSSLFLKNKYGAGYNLTLVKEDRHKSPTPFYCQADEHKWCSAILSGNTFTGALPEQLTSDVIKSPSYDSDTPHAIYRFFAANVSGSSAPVQLKVSSHPLPLTASSKAVFGSFISFSACIFIVIAFTFFPASIVVFLVREKQSEHNAKHQQLVSGVSLGAFWLSNYLWDLLTYIVPFAAAVILIKAFGIPSLTGNGCVTCTESTFVSVIVLFFCFGLAICPFTYCLSYLFREHASSQMYTIMINFVIGVVLLVVSFKLDSAESTKDVNAVLVFIWRLSPLFNLGNGLLRLTMNEMTAVLSGDKEKKSSFSTDLMGYELIFLVLSAVVFSAAAVGIDYALTFPNVKKNLMSGASSVDEEAFDEDVDVRNEAQRVQEGASDDVVVLMNLRKVYPGGPVAVCNLSFGLKRGECFGFLGINGAGKTSTMKMLTGDVLPSSGTATLGGFDILTQQIQVRRQIGYCPQFDALFELLTVREHLELFARIKGVSRAHLDDVVTEKIHQLNLEAFENKLAGSLSGGNKRKLSVAIAMIGDPRIIFLDEPSTGMDPVSRRFMWDVIAGISTRSKSATIVLTTHSMEESEALCSRVGIMVGGRLRCLGSVQHLKSRFGDGLVLDVKMSAPQPHELEEVMERIFGQHSGAVTANDLDDKCQSFGNASLASRIEPGHPTGYSLAAAMDRDGFIRAEAFAAWCMEETRFDELDGFLRRSFGDVNVQIMERHNDFCRFKLRDSNDQLKLSKVFALVEDIKTRMHIRQYSVSQTTLEQIFNNFAAQQGEEKTVVRGMNVASEYQ
ncbi:hypothetical protein ATCC90586_008083 [Pythium insidiosum]|nr:hypothetical protein ATCC90586_008083 [Pythium insidiosum]